MIRNLKALGLAVLVVLAIGAIGASSASAVGKFTSTSYPQHLIGTDIGAEDIFTVTGASQVSCAEESFTAEIKGASLELTVTPNFKKCTTFNSNPPGEFTILMNGCDFRFTVSETVSADNAKGGFHLVCPTGKFMETWQYPGPTAHSENATNCKVTTAPQTGTGSVTYASNTSSKDLEIKGTMGLIGLMHGQCSFGLTFNTESSYHFGVTFQTASGAALHVG